MTAAKLDLNNNWQSDCKRYFANKVFLLRTGHCDFLLKTKSFTACSDSAICNIDFFTLLLTGPHLGWGIGQTVHCTSCSAQLVFSLA